VISLHEILRAAQKASPMHQPAHVHRVTRLTFEVMLSGFEETLEVNEDVVEVAAGGMTVGTEAVRLNEITGTEETTEARHHTFVTTEEVAIGGLAAKHSGGVAHHRLRVEDVHQTMGHAIVEMHYRLWRLIVRAEVQGTDRFLGALLVPI